MKHGNGCLYNGQMELKATVGSLGLIGSAMFGATFNLIASVGVP